MNLSETAYPQRRPDGDWDLRWFTPAAEVDLCGHATLASAHLLFERGMVDTESVTFHTRSGALTCRRTQSGEGIVMDFPASPPEAVDEVAGLSEALGVEVVSVARSFDLLVELVDASAVRSVAPDQVALNEIDTRAVVVTAEADEPDTDFVSRVFGPRVGIPEDPVTGSSHCILAPWWGARLGLTEMRAHQVSARGGRLVVRLKGSGDDARVELEGQAVTVMDATLHA